MIKNNFEEALQKTEERFKELTNTINFLNDFKNAIHNELFCAAEDHIYARTSALDIIDCRGLLKKHADSALQLLEKFSIEYKVSPQNKILIALKEALDEHDKLKYELKEEILINTLYTLYGEKDATIERLVTFNKLKEQQVTELFEGTFFGELLSNILDNKHKFSWFEKKFLLVIITEVNFNINELSPINNDFNILVNYKVGNRKLCTEVIEADRLLKHIEKPIKLK